MTRYIIVDFRITWTLIGVNQRHINRMNAIEHSPPTEEMSTYLYNLL